MFKVKVTIAAPNPFPGTIDTTHGPFSTRDKAETFAIHFVSDRKDVRQTEIYPVQEKDNVYIHADTITGRLTAMSIPNSRIIVYWGGRQIAEVKSCESGMMRVLVWQTDHEYALATNVSPGYGEDKSLTEAKEQS